MRLNISVHSVVPGVQVMNVSPLPILGQVTRRKRTKAFVVAGAAAFVVIDIVLAVWFVTWLQDDSPSVEEIRTELSEALPAGSTEEQVSAFLGERSYLFRASLADPDTDTLASRQGLTTGTPLIVASYSDRDGDRTIVMYFVLNADRLLDRTIVEERILSP